MFNNGTANIDEPNSSSARASTAGCRVGPRLPLARQRRFTTWRQPAGGDFNTLRDKRYTVNVGYGIASCRPTSATS